MYFARKRIPEKTSTRNSGSEKAVEYIWSVSIEIAKIIELTNAVGNRVGEMLRISFATNTMLRVNINTFIIAAERNKSNPENHFTTAILMENSGGHAMRGISDMMSLRP